MKLMKYFLALVIVVPNICFAQGPGSAAVPFLQIGPSPTLGSGYGANAVLPSDDTYGFYYNPAQLANFARKNNFSLQFYPVKTDWLPQFNFSDLTFNSYALSYGKIYKNLFDLTDVSIGVGYMHTMLNLGQVVWTNSMGNEIGTFNSKEFYDAFSLGFGFDYYAQFSFGLTYKNIVSELAPIKIIVGKERNGSGTAEASALDFGMMVSIPVLKDHSIDRENAVYLNEKMSLFSNAYFGYAFTNFGDEIFYVDEKQKDPLPRTAQLGIGLSLGLLYDIGYTNIKFLELEMANEANDLLITRKDSTSIAYQGGVGDIDFIDNILLGNSDKLVSVSTTIRVRIAEIFSVGFHKMKGPGFDSYVHNTSFSISSRGFFKLVPIEEEEEIIKFIINNVDLRYAWATTSSHNDSPLDGTNYKGVSINIHSMF